MTQQDLALCPQITPILTTALGSWHKAVDALRFSKDDSARALLSVYDQLPEVDRERLPLEAICLKAEVSPAAILGATLMAAKGLAAMEANLALVANHGAVMKSTIDFARDLPGAVKDREMVHQMFANRDGFLPTSKGVSMSVNLLNGNPQFSGDEDGEGDDDYDSFDRAFPSLNSNLEQWGERRKKLLTDGK